MRSIIDFLRNLVVRRNSLKEIPLHQPMECDEIASSDETMHQQKANICNETNLNIGIVGQFQVGKSLLINCLLNRNIATVGKGCATTHTIIEYVYSNNEYLEYTDDNGVLYRGTLNDLNDIDTKSNIVRIKVSINNELLKSVRLIDMPGFGANHPTDTLYARMALSELDYALVITTNEKSYGSSHEDIDMLQRYRIPYHLIINCSDSHHKKWAPTNPINSKIAEASYSILSFYKPQSYPFKEGAVPIVNLMWYWYATQPADDTILQRKEIDDNIQIYKLCDQVDKQVILKASNFCDIQKIFSMEHLAIIELRKYIKSEIQALKDEVCPVGTIQTFAFNQIPSGWIACDGRKVAISDYPELYDVIGSTFGEVSSEEKHFFLPDLQGKFVRGWDENGKIDDNRLFGSDQSDSVQDHSHKITYQKETGSAGGHSHDIEFDGRSAVTSVGGLGNTEASRTFYSADTIYDKKRSTDYKNSHSHSIPTIHIESPISINNSSIRISKETRPQNIALMFCIKAK